MENEQLREIFKCQNTNMQTIMTEMMLFNFFIKVTKQTVCCGLKL